jgi:hypothetical protein
MIDNPVNCTCPKKKCPRHAKCEECAQYHANKGKLPYCKRPKLSLFGLLKKKTMGALL